MGFLACEQARSAIMSLDEDGDFAAFERRSGACLRNEEDQILVNNWDPLLSMDRGVNFHGSSAGFPSYMVGMPGFHGVDVSGCSRSEQVSGLPCIESESYSEMVGDPFGLCETGGGVPRALCQSGFPSVHDSEKNAMRKKRKGMLECDDLPTVHVETALHEENVSPETVRCSREEMKSNSEMNPGCRNSKPMGKNAKDPSNGADSTKDDYIHVRAKRGQATNSHSLAERVRREKISERMKLLQDLVPGCNKITGKAMMLDEIINYVQSLQRQVEFLSMKLATVNPEISIDIEQILSKDILHSQGSSAAAFSFSHGLNIPPNSLGRSLQSDLLLCNLPSSGSMRTPANPLLPWISQIPNMWERDLEGVFPMGFVPDANIDSKELNGAMKSEL